MILAGHEFYAYSYEYLKAGKTNLVDGILELRPGTTLYAADSYTDKYRIESWLGRFNYNYDEKYYFSALCVPMDLLVFIKIIVGEHSGLSVVTGAFPKKRSWKMLNGLIICL